MDRGSDTGDGTPMGGSKKVHEYVGRLPRALFIFPHFQKTAPTERRCPAQVPTLPHGVPPFHGATRSLHEPMSSWVCPSMDAPQNRRWILAIPAHVRYRRA